MGIYKNRYLLIYIITEDRVWSDPVVKAIEKSILSLYGSIGLAEICVSMRLKYFSNATKSMIIRVSREYEKMLKMAITLIKEIKPKEETTGKIQKCTLITKHSSGSMKAVQKVIVKINKRGIEIR